MTTTLPETETGTRLCACGCGEPAPPRNNYKRGHRDARGTRSKPPTTVSAPPEQTFGPYTLDEATETVPDDPDPADSDDAKPHLPTIRITKRVKDDIEGKLGMVYGFVTLGVEIKDPICGSALADNAEDICAKMVPIICKSPAMVKWFTAGGGYMVWFELIMVFMPVIKVVMAHHVLHTVGVEPKGHDGKPVPSEMYRV